MTPEEANKKWCPMVRWGEAGETGYNREYNNFPTAPDPIRASPRWNGCVADACMMWRWQSFRNGVGFDGYCGLAGKDGAP